jgi:hypothetical protein
VYVFTKTATGWTQTAELKGSGTVDDFGISVAISGTTVVVGAASAMEALGEAYVFTKKANRWTQTAELKGGDDFGGAVAISGTTAVVGSDGYVNSAGLACVFTKTADAWRQVAGLKGSDTIADDVFGDSVAISGTTVVVGAPNHANSAGLAYVFTKTAGAWRQTPELKGSDTVGSSNTFQGDYFGTSVAISGTTAVVGAPGAGRAYVFEA